MVEQAQGAKLPIQALVDKVTAWFVPAVMGVAALTFVLWLWLGPAPALSYALIQMVAVLIIACPCAMGLATPTSIMVGTGRGAELGVLFRKGDALQTLANVSAIALDKTGTITKGRPELTDFLVAPGFDRAEVPRLRRGCRGAFRASDRGRHRRRGERGGGVRQRGGQPCRAKPSREWAGFGVAEVLVLVEARKRMFSIRPGPAKQPEQLARRRSTSPRGRALVRSRGRRAPCRGRRGSLHGGARHRCRAFAEAAARFGEEAKSPLYAAIDGKLAGLLVIADPIAPNARHAVEALREQGLEVVMVTGDNRRTAEAVAKEVGIETVRRRSPAGRQARGAARASRAASRDRLCRRWHQ